MPIVEVNGQEIEFPDSMSSGQIKDVLRQKFPMQEQPQAQVEQPMQPSMAESVYQGAKQGATFGFGDELQSGIAAGTVGLANLLGQETGKLTAAQTYKQSMADYKAERDASKQTNPIAYGAGEVLGSIPTGIGASKAIGGKILEKAIRIAPKTATVGLGGISGATYGFGTGEGDVQERLKQARDYGVFGIAGGAIGAKVSSSLAKLALSKAVAPATENIVGKSIRDIGIESAGEVIKQAPMKSELTAMDKITKAVKKDFPNDWENVLTAWKNGDVPLAELYSSRLTDLAKGAAQYPSGKKIAKEYFEGKVLQTPEKIRDSISRNISSVENYHKTADDLLRAGQKIAEPKYEAALKVNVGADTRLNEFLTTPEAQKAFKEGLNLQRIESIAAGKPFNPTDYAVTAFNEAGDPIIGQVPNMKSFNAVKRGLDTMIKSETDTLTRKVTDNGRALIQFKNSMLNRLDELNPLYKEARQSAGDYFKIDDAIHAGKNFAKTDPELLQKSLKGMSATEKDAFKIGVGKQIRDSLDNVVEGRNPYNKIFGTPKQKEQLAKVLSPKEFKNLEHSLRAEDKMFKMKNEVLGGSPTVSKAIAAAEFDQGGVEALSTLANKGIIGAGFEAINLAVKKLKSGLSDNTANAVSRLIYETDPAKKVVLFEKVLGDKKLSTAEKLEIKKYYFVADDFIKSRTAGAIGGSMLAQEGNK